MTALIVALAMCPAPLLAQDDPPVDCDAGPVDRMMRVDARGDQRVLSPCGATGTVVPPICAE
jgi:hypothetical protein